MSIERLAAKVAAIPLNRRGRRRYPAPLRREIMAALSTSGLTQRDFAAKVGVPHGSFANWQDLAPPRPAKRPTPGFKAIALEPEATAVGLCLRAPGGIVLENLSVAAAAELIAALTARSPC